jgi:DNA-binding SARP family transcriptional activator
MFGTAVTVQIRSMPTHYNVQIRALGAMQVATGGNTLVLGHRRVRKPLELLRALIATGRQGASRDELCASVWDLPREAAYRPLVTTVFRLRRLLGDSQSVIFSNRRLALDPARVWVDAWQFEDVCQSPAPCSPDVVAALALYRGPLFEGQFAPYIVSARLRLCRLFVVATVRAGNELVTAGALAAAQLHYEKALQYECRSEELFCALIEVLGLRGRGTAATIAYNSCAVAMRRFHGRLPSAATRDAWATAVGGTEQMPEDISPISGMAQLPGGQPASVS